MRKVRLKKMRTERTRIRKGIIALAILAALCALGAWGAAEDEDAATLTDLEPAEIIAQVSGGVQDLDGVWHLTRSDREILVVIWNDAGADRYDVTLSGPDDVCRQKAVITPAWKTPETGLPAGDYTLDVAGWKAGTLVCAFSVELKLEEPGQQPSEEPAEEPAEEPSEKPEEPAEEPSEKPEEPAEEPSEEKPSEEPAEEPSEKPEEPAEEPPEEPGKDPSEEPGEEQGENPGRPSGGRKPSGSFPSGAGKKGGDDRNTSRITAGKALTSTHARGTGKVLAYGAVELKAGNGAMPVLTLGGEELALSCGDSEFTAEVRDDVLVLRTDGADDWSLTLDTLETLNISGVRQVEMISPEAETALDTGLELSGAAYGLERSRGFVSTDFLLFRGDGEWHLQVEDREYPLEIEWNDD